MPVDSDVAVLLDCKSEMTEIGNWLGKGSPATLAGVANEDLLRPIIEMKLETTSVERYCDVPTQGQGTGENRQMKKKKRIGGGAYSEIGGASEYHSITFKALTCVPPM